MAVFMEVVLDGERTGRPSDVGRQGQRQQERQSSSPSSRSTASRQVRSGRLVRAEPGRAGDGGKEFENQERVPQAAGQVLDVDDVQPDYACIKAAGGGGGGGSRAARARRLGGTERPAAASSSQQGGDGGDGSPGRTEARAAFEQVYRATCAHLLGVAFRILNNRERAEEVLQEAL